MSEDNPVKRRKITAKTNFGDVMASQKSTNNGKKTHP